MDKAALKEWAQANVWMARQLAAAMSFEPCVIIGCSQEAGHEGNHDKNEPVCKCGAPLCLEGTCMAHCDHAVDDGGAAVPAPSASEGGPKAVTTRYGESVCPECGGTSDWAPFPACGTCKEGEQGIESDGMP